MFSVLYCVYTHIRHTINNTFDNIGYYIENG